MPTPNLNLPYILASQSQKHVTHNEALVALDTLTQVSILDRNLSTPPGSPSEGDTYIVGSTATGDWSGEENSITTYYDSVWRFYTPKEGWLVYVVDEGVHLKFDGTSWVAAFTQSGATWGWQDWSHGGSSQTLTLASTFYALENDGAGSYTNTSFKVPSHGNIWDTTTDLLDLSDLSIGDEVTIRADLEVTTSASNHEISVRLRLDMGGTPFNLTLEQKSFKSAGTHQLTVQKSFYVGSAGVRDNPAEIQIASDNTGDSVQVLGWYIKTQVR